MKKNKKRKGLFKHFKSIGFSNRLAVYIIIFLLLGLVGGFYLGLQSIENEYMGTLLCWTVVFTPIGTATSICLSRIVDKSKAENTIGGIKYETAINSNTSNEDYTTFDYNINSPAI